MRLVLLLVAIMALAMIPKDHRLFSAVDDDDYFAYSTSIAFGEYPSFRKDYYHAHWKYKMPMAAGGSGLLAAPFVFAMSSIDHINNHPIVQERTEHNRHWTWSAVGFHMASCFYVILGSFLLYSFLTQWCDKKAATLMTLLTLTAGGGIFIYAFRRPVMTHAFEFFSVTWALYLASLIIQKKRSQWTLPLVGVASAVLFLVRYNNILLATVLVAIGLFYNNPDTPKMILKRSWQLFLPAGILVFLIRILPILSNGYNKQEHTYEGALERILPSLDPYFYLQRILDIVFGLDMGILYTAPVLLLAIAAIPWTWRKIPAALLWISSVALLNLYLAIMWRSTGSYYGYRYLTFTAIPLLAIFLCKAFEFIPSKSRTLAYSLIFIFVSFLPLFSIFAFERLMEFCVIPFTNEYGVETHSQPTYHKDLINVLITSPLDIFKLVWEQGFGALLSTSSVTNRDKQRIFLYAWPWILFALYSIYEHLRKKYSRK